MTAELRELMGHHQYRPLIEYIAREGGLTTRPSPLDYDARVDPYELAMQKAQRDFAWSLIEAMGWTWSFASPTQAAIVRQTVADSDGAPNGHG